MYAHILQVALAKGVGDVALKKYLNMVKDNKFDQVDMEILQKIKFNANIIKNIQDCAERGLQLEQRCQQSGVAIITEHSTMYPRYLKSVLKDKCPPILFAQGNIELLHQVGVGFCGSREVSVKGCEIASNCATQLTAKNATVISGYANGTDITVHREALVSNGNTIFVLAEGILKKKIKAQINSLLTEKNHVFISQFLPDTGWNVGNAMKRNSTIIGLSRAMILVESKMNGGTFAAGEEALRTNSPLFVIDFEKPEVSAEANPYFINRGGKPIRGQNKIPDLEELFSEVDKTLDFDYSDSDDNEQLSLFTLVNQNKV